MSPLAPLAAILALIWALSALSLAFKSRSASSGFFSDGSGLLKILLSWAALGLALDHPPLAAPCPGY